MYRIAIALGLAIAFGGHLQAQVADPLMSKIAETLEVQRNNAQNAHAVAQARVSILTEENAKLKAELEELKKANGDSNAK